MPSSEEIEDMQRELEELREERANVSGVASGILVDLDHMAACVEKLCKRLRAELARPNRSPDDIASLALRTSRLANEMAMDAKLWAGLVDPC